MMYGHLETEEDILDHLESIRALQDETGGFTAFVPWSFKPTDAERDWLARLAVVFFLMFNIVALTWVWWRFLSWIYFYPAFILFFTIFYAFFKKIPASNFRLIAKRSALIALLSLLFVPAFLQSCVILLRCPAASGLMPCFPI